MIPAEGTAATVERREDGMVRHLLIVRHAKSDWGDPSLADHDRLLAPRGIRALDRMRGHLADGPQPSLVLCSSARRTVDTLGGIRAALPDDVEVRVLTELYGASGASLLDRLRTVDDDVSTAMLVGHNPSVHDLTLTLVGGGDLELRSWMAGKFPTGAIATLSFESTWAALRPADARLDGFFTPRRG